jgi:hypothetical protein
MHTPIPLSLAAAALLVTGAPPCSPSDDVPFDTVLVVSGSGGINLVAGAAVAVRTPEDRADLGRLLEHGVASPEMPEAVLEAVDAVPADRVALVGVIDTSCDPQTTPGLRRDAAGNVTMYTVDPVDSHAECFVAVDTVAVLAVDPSDVPIGAADASELVAFEPVDPVGSVEIDETGSTGPVASTAVELTAGDDALTRLLGPRDAPPVLPPVARGTRRLAFVRPGCQDTTAEMIVTRRFVEPRLYHEPLSERIECFRAEWFLSVFDVAADVLGPTVTIDA